MQWVQQHVDVEVWETAHSDGVGQEHDGHDHQEAWDISPGSLQRGCDHVQLRV